MKVQVKMPVLHPQKPSDVERIAASIRQSTMEQRLDLLISAGIFTSDRRLTERYRPLADFNELND